MSKKIKILAVILVVLATVAFLLKDKIFTERVVVLETPTENTSEEEKYDYAVQRAALAEETGLLDITNCIATPEVFKVESGATFNIRNAGDSQRELYFQNRGTIAVPANSTIQLDANFGENQNHGLYGYGCDLRTDGSRIGQILVTF